MSRWKKVIRYKGIRPRRRYGTGRKAPATYTTRHGQKFTAHDDDHLAFDALAGLEAEKINPPDALAWLVDHGFAKHDQPDTHDNHLIRLVDGRDIQWNGDVGWEPGGWLHRGI